MIDIGETTEARNLKIFANMIIYNTATKQICLYKFRNCHQNTDETIETKSLKILIKNMTTNCIKKAFCFASDSKLEEKIFCRQNTAYKKS